jgi:hypothetical protein
MNEFLEQQRQQSLEARVARLYEDDLRKWRESGAEVDCRVRLNLPPQKKLTGEATFTVKWQGKSRTVSSSFEYVPRRHGIEEHWYMTSDWKDHQQQ